MSRWMTDVFTDSIGAYFAGITATNIWQFTTKPAGPVNPRTWSWRRMAAAIS